MHSAVGSSQSSHSRPEAPVCNVNDLVGRGSCCEQRAWTARDQKNQLSWSVQDGPEKVDLLIFVAITLSSANPFFANFWHIIPHIHCRKLATGGYVVSPPNTVCEVIHYLDHDFLSCSVVH